MLLRLSVVLVGAFDTFWILHGDVAITHSWSLSAELETVRRTDAYYTAKLKFSCQSLGCVLYKYAYCIQIFMVCICACK